MKIEFYLMKNDSTTNLTTAYNEITREHQLILDEKCL